MTDNQAVKIEVKGLDKIIKAFAKFPREIMKDIKDAGEESADEILNVKGLRNYPELTDANMPPTPYYKRGKGMQYASRNALDSENLSKKWTVVSQGYKTTIGNTASYAKWVHGKDDQAKAMGRIGWRKLFDVAKDKTQAIQKIYQKWINHTIKRLGL